jgi:hypothetical protein
LLIFGVHPGKGKYAIVALHNADPNDPKDPFCGAEWDQATSLDLFRSLYGVSKIPNLNRPHQLC